MKEDKFLPIGTIVILKNGTRKIMITSYLIVSGGTDKEKQKMFDYGGCPYPAGIIESSYAVGFNHNQIDKVVHLGHIDEEQKELNEILNKNYQEFQKLVQ